MVQVTNTNLISAPRNNVVTLISNTSNVSDPIVSSSEFRKWIYSRTPDIKANDFSGFPFIVIGPSIFTPGKESNLSGTRKFVEWTIHIEIFSSDRGYGSKDGQGLSHNDSITNNVLTTLLDITNRKNLIYDGMAFSEPVVSDISVEGLANELIYKRTISLTFADKIKVSVE